MSNCKGTLRLVFICLRPRIPITPYTLYMCTVYRTYSHSEGGRGESWPKERRGDGQQFTKLGRKSQHDWLYLQSINSDKQLPQSPFTSITGLFWDNDILLWCLLYCSYVVHGARIHAPWDSDKPLKVPSHQIRLGWKWYGWIGLGGYKVCRW
jgi:hypothetical protein